MATSPAMQVHMTVHAGVAVAVTKLELLHQ